jgi:ribonuclease D
MEETTLIETQEALRELAASLSEVPELAVDTESNSFHNYHERICLLQISVPGTDYLIDPIALQDLSPLKAIFADPGPEKIFHAAENDVVLLKKHFGFEFSNVFDTLLAAQILGYREVGLASLLSRFFSIHLDKGEQRSDWSRRPLSADQLRYAVDDTRHLIALRDKLHGELVKGMRLKVAKEEFDRLAAKQPVERAPDPGAYLRLKGARKLPAERRGRPSGFFRTKRSSSCPGSLPPPGRTWGAFAASLRASSRATAKKSWPPSGWGSRRVKRPPRGPCEAPDGGGRSGPTRWRSGSCASASGETSGPMRSTSSRSSSLPTVCS